MFKDRLGNELHDGDTVRGVTESQRSVTGWVILDPDRNNYRLHVDGVALVEEEDGVHEVKLSRMEKVGA